MRRLLKEFITAITNLIQYKYVHSIIINYPIFMYGLTFISLVIHLQYSL